MKRIFSLVLALCLTATMVCASDTADTAYEAYHIGQPINREIIDKTQMPQQQTQTTQTTYVYDDPYISYQWAISATGADLAWETVSNDYSVVVAVVDTGVDYSHEDLENRVLIDLAYDFVNGDSDPMDDNGHGTHVAGIIAAEADNGVGIAGIAGTLDVSILPVKVLDADGTGETATIAKGILYAVEQDVDIINLSLGADIITPDVRDAIETALNEDIFVVVAAGNDGTVCAPLSLANLDGVFTVAAATESSTVADFSNYGSAIDGYAPGEEILSTYLDNQYAFQDGTSMASPVVAGAAAILLSQDPDLTNAELTVLLSNTTTSTQTYTPTTQTMPVISQAVPVATQPVVTQPVVTQPVITQPGFRTQSVWNTIAYSNTTATTACNIINVYTALQKL